MAAWLTATPGVAVALGVQPSGAGSADWHFAECDGVEDRRAAGLDGQQVRTVWSRLFVKGGKEVVSLKRPLERPDGSEVHHDCHHQLPSAARSRQYS